MKRHERLALELLTRGPDTVGLIDSEEKLAAALVFADLNNRGLAIAVIGNNGPTYRITPAGRMALADSPSKRGA